MKCGCEVDEKGTLWLCYECWLESEQDYCICIDGELNVNCRWCF